MKRYLSKRLLPFALAILAANASPEVPSRSSHISLNVGACGAQPIVSERLVAERIARVEGNGAVALQRYFAAHRDPPRVSMDHSNRILFLEGVITRSTSKAVAGAIANFPTLKNLTINSFGGNARAAMEIADTMKSHGMSITVRGFCMSACSIYFIPSATEVILDDGVVGMHGRPITCYEQLSVWRATQQWGVRNFLEFREVAMLDAKFAATTPRLSTVAQLSQRPDRGGRDGVVRDWLLVSPGRLGEIGVVHAEVRSTDTFDLIKSNLDDSLVGSVYIY